MLQRIKNLIFIKQINKLTKVYLLPLILSLWGIGNVIYWEIYKGYPACIFCKWHRALYIIMFISLLLLWLCKKFIFKLILLLTIITETIVSIFQVFGLWCDPMACRKVTNVEYVNLLAISVTLILLILTEVYYIIKNRTKHPQLHKDE